MKAWLEYIWNQGDDEYLWDTGAHFLFGQSALRKF